MKLNEKGQKVVSTAKKLGILAIVLIVAYFGYTKFVDEKGKSLLPSAGKPDLIIGYNTFSGVAGLVYINGGMEPTEESPLYKKYGIKVQIKQMDVVKDTRSALFSGDLDLAYCTTDALPIEMGSGSDMVENGIVQIMHVNKSVGADAIVARKGINTVQDLKGKKIAFAVGTASHTLLLNVLESSGLKMSDIEEYRVADGVVAATAFKNGECDAALVWAPDDEDCVQALTGSKILISTAVATQIIADGLIVKKSVLKEKHDDIYKLVAGWLEGNGLVNSDPKARKEAIALFAKGFNFPEDIAALSANKVYFATLADNLNFFGLNTSYNGVTGDRMYGRMAVKYAEIGLASSPVAWRNASDPSIIEEIAAKETDLKNSVTQTALKEKVLAPATKEIKEATAQSSKVTSLEFATNSYQLTEDTKAIIDREIEGLAKGFTNAYIRVEGNTDNVGSDAANIKLSYSRAQAVVDYLIKEHKFDKDKFIVVGNGSSKPVAGYENNNNEEARSKNRRTEFQFIWSK